MTNYDYKRIGCLVLAGMMVGAVGYHFYQKHQDDTDKKALSGKTA